MDASHLIGRQLESVRIGTPRRPLHQAWINERTPDINSPFVHLYFVGASAIEIVPCEVDVLNEYPALGIELREAEHPAPLRRWPGGSELGSEAVAELGPVTPATVAGVRVWDAIGEGVPSALDMTLSTGTIVTVRHIYPPMTLGIDLKTPKGRRSEL